MPALALTRSTSFLIVLCSLFTVSSGKVYRGFNDIAPMPIAVSDMTATIIEKTEFQDQLGPRVYVIGGCSGNQLCPPGEFCYCTEVTNTCNIFFIETQSWKSCPSLPLIARCRHSATYFQGKIYLFGGRDVADAVVQEVEIFDVASGAWLESLNWKNATSDGGAFTDETSIYLIGGYDANYAPLATLTQFTPSSTIWNTDLPPMSYARGDIGVIAVPKEKNHPTAGSYYFVIGGFADNICVPLSVVETFDPLTKLWTTHTSLHHPRADLALGVLQGLLFAIAGETKDPLTCNSTSYIPGVSIPVKDVERLEKIDDLSWNYEEDIPDNRFRFVAASYKDAIYLFGGQGDLIQPSSSSIDTTPYYPVQNTTMLYVPKSIADQQKLNDGEIAGIVIGCVGFLILLVFLALIYLVYRKYHGYTLSAEENEEQTSGGDNGAKTNQAGKETEAKEIEVSFSFA
jgi:hypothetical protein